MPRGVYNRKPRAANTSLNILNEPAPYGYKEDGTPRKRPVPDWLRKPPPEEDHLIVSQELHGGKDRRTIELKKTPKGYKLVKVLEGDEAKIRKDMGLPAKEFDSIEQKEDEAQFRKYAGQPATHTVKILLEAEYTATLNAEGLTSLMEFVQHLKSIVAGPAEPVAVVRLELHNLPGSITA
jgi:hypothetical protein